MAEPARQPDLADRGWRIAAGAAVALGAVLAARTLIPESFEALRPSFLSDVPRGPGPETVVWLDAICLLLAVVVCVLRGAWRRDRVAWIGIGLLAVAIGISTAAAADKRVALNAGSHLVIMTLAALALRHGLDRALRRVVIAVLVAAAALNAVKCVTQRAYEFRETLETWQEQKRQLAARGVPVDTPEIRNFERRLRSKQAFGYLYHPNVTAAIMAAGLLVVLGGTKREERSKKSETGGESHSAVASGLHARRDHAERPRRTGTSDATGSGGASRTPPTARGGLAAVVPWLCAAALAGLLAVGVYLTGSLGAMLSAAVGAVVLITLVLGRRQVALHRRRTLALLAAVYLGGFAGLLGWGLARGTLPGASLAFRWQYWTAAVRAWREHPWTGIGRENFAAAYLRHKPIESTEQVRNPHNLWLTLLVETGPLGLAAGLLLIGAALAVAVPGCGEDSRGRLSPTTSKDSRGRLSPTVTKDSRGRLFSMDAPDSRGWSSPAVRCDPPTSLRRWVILAAVATLGTQAVFSRTPFDQPGIAVIWSIEVALVFAALLVAAALAVDLRSRGRHVGLDAGLLAAIFATLVHNLIGFSLFTPAGLAMLTGLIGVAAARQKIEPPRPVPWPRWLMAATVVISHAAVVVIPTTRSQLALARAEAGFARAATAGQLEAAIAEARRAVAADRWDATPALVLARRIARVVARLPATERHRAGWLALAQHYARLALERRRDDVAALRLLSELDLLATSPPTQTAASTQRAVASRAAAERLERVTQLNPASLRDHFVAGWLWYQLWRQTRDPAAAALARVHFQTVLKIDATRDPRATDRLSEAQRRQIDEALAALGPGSG